MEVKSQIKVKRLLSILTILFCLSLGRAYAQSIPVTLKMTDVRLEKVLDAIEQQTTYLFVYNKNVDMARIVSINEEEAPLQRVLDKLFKSTNIVYAVENTSIVLSVPSQANAIQNTITGKVVDLQNIPVIEATVIIKGSTIGTSTDFDGNFTLQIPAGYENPVLVVNYLGYQSAEIVIGNQKKLKIVLKESAVSMEEVVVTALGIKRSEKALSYNVQKMGEEDILTVKDVNFVNSLNGKIAGVTINNSSSGVGGASKVVMRGTKGIDQSSNALYVIDGIPMYNLGGEGETEFGSAGTSEPIADINPEDIESISVLTGAAAAALYGSHASNGAIVITTKKGKAGNTTLTVSSNTEILTPFVTPGFQNRYGTGDLTSEVAVLDKSWGHRLNSSNFMGYSPTKDYMQTGIVGTETVALSTGTERNQTYLSASAVNSRGIIPNNGYSRYNFTFRNTTSFLNDKMTLDLGASYIKQKDRNMINQGIYSNPLVPAYLFPRGNDWEDIEMFERYDASRRIMTQYWPQGSGELVSQNPYWINHRNLRNNNKDRYMLNANLSYEILDWLSVSGRVRIDNSTNNYIEKFYATTNKTIAEGSDNGLYGITTTHDKQAYADVLLNINKSFEAFSIQANIGASLSDMQQDELKNRGPIRNDGLPNVFNVFQLDDTNTKREQRGWHEQTQSVFASVELGFKNAYYLTLTGRNDWPSQLAGPKSEKSSFFYPSVGGSLVLSEIISMPTQISYLKLRGSFASVGLPFARFLANPTYEWDNSNKVWQTKSIYPLYNLKPERTNSWEIGLTSRFLKNFNLDISYYDTKTFNQTFDPKISVSSGYSTLFVQTGNVRNRGVELSLGYKNTWNKFIWNSNFTFGANRNKILELVDNYIHPETGIAITKNRLDIGGLAQARFILKKGGTLGDLYSIADLQRDSEGNIYVDQHGNVSAQYNVDDIKLGSVFPKCNLAWRNDFKWNNFSFGLMVSARIGGIVYSATQAALDLYGVSEASAVARDNGGAIVNGGDKIPAQKWYTAIGAQSGIPQYYTYSATNVRLQEASIGYTVPRQKLGNVMEITVSLVGRNLWMIYSKAPFDPEAVATTGSYYQGIDNFMMPSTRNVGFNVRMKF